MARSTPMSGSEAQSPLVTWDDFVLLDEEDRRELIDGVLVETEVNELPHEAAVAALIFRLEGWARTTGGGRTLGSNYRIRISDRRGVTPDVQFLSKETLALADRKGFTRGVPDLVVEVISPSSSRYDRVVKLGWYAAAGVREYWIVEPVDRTLQRLVLGANGRYSIADSLADDAVFEPDSFPGLAIPLAELWIDPPTSP